MRVLDMLYNGKLIPLEIHQSVSSAYKEKCDEIGDLEKAFVDKLGNHEMKAEFIRIIDERTGLVPDDCRQLFIQGMCLGARLALELTGWHAQE